MSQLCPCGSGLEYSLCCQPYLNDERVAATPALLMRSRYSAFVTNNADYLIKTWHPECVSPGMRAELEKSFAATRWLGLTVYEQAEGREANEGFVSFVARFEESGSPGAIIERSRFLRQNDRWYYVDGVRPQFGRNDICPCGSGKKFKKCCGR